MATERQEHDHIPAWELPQKVDPAPLRRGNLLSQRHVRELGAKAMFCDRVPRFPYFQ